MSSYNAPPFVEPRSRSPSKSKSPPPGEAAGAGVWTGAGVGSATGPPPSRSNNVSDCRGKGMQGMSKGFSQANKHSLSYRLFCWFLFSDNFCN